MSSESAFEGDPDFCVECGTILPLPGSKDRVICLACGSSVSIQVFDGLTSVSVIQYNHKGKYKQKKQKEKEQIDTVSGPLVDRECAKCGNPSMSYATIQTRSADEGQTVFYSCPKCKYSENENS